MMAVSSAVMLLGGFYQQTWRHKREIVSQAKNETTDSNTDFVDNLTLFTAKEPLLDKIEREDEIVLCLHGIIFLLALVGNGLVRKSLYSTLFNKANKLVRMISKNKADCCFMRLK